MNLSIITKYNVAPFLFHAETLKDCIKVDEAILMAKEAIGLYVESLVAHNEPVPDESNTLEYSLTLDAAV